MKKLSLAITMAASALAVTNGYTGTMGPVSQDSLTGFYVNLGGGYGMWNANTSTVNPVTGAGVLPVNQIQGGRGGFGVAGLGFDYQVGPSFLVGVLVDDNFGNIRGTIQDQNTFFAGTIKQNNAYSAGARAGLVVGSAVPYFNAGYTQAHFNGATMVNTITGVVQNFATPGFNTNGWFVGVGAEAPVMMSGLYVRGEYRYSRYDNRVLADNSTVGGIAANSIAFRPEVSTFAGELVYKFNF